MLLLLVALKIWRQTFKGSFTTPQSGRDTFMFSKFNRITLLKLLRAVVSNAVQTEAYNCSHRHASFLRLSQVTQRKGKASTSIKLPFRE